MVNSTSARRREVLLKDLEALSLLVAVLKIPRPLYMIATVKKRTSWRLEACYGRVS